jgi:hypothetical protein
MRLFRCEALVMVRCVESALAMQGLALRPDAAK